MRSAWLKILLVITLFAGDAVAQPTAFHDLAFNHLAKSWDEGVPLGNGMIGALVWEKNGRLRFALDRADLWDERPMKGLHRPEFSYAWVLEQVKKNNYSVVQQYFDAPYDREAGPTKISGGAMEFDITGWGDIKNVSLSLKQAHCVVKWASGAQLQTFVDATRPVGWFRFTGINQALNPSLITPGYHNETGKPLDSLKSNDPAKLGYPKGEITSSNQKIHYHQPGYNGFYYDIAVEWKQVGNGNIEGAWSITSNYGGEQANADAIVSQALTGSYQNALEDHLKWWTNFWSKSTLQVPDTTIEKQWYRDQYKFGATARKDAPPILLQGVWTADNGRLPPWKGDYHHDLNTEMSYWPAYSANHLDEAMAFIDHLEGNRVNYRKYTKDYFNVDGINVPGVTTLSGTEMGGWIQYALSPTVAAWLSQHFYLQWRYSMDTAFLAKRAYPWFREVAAYLEGITIKNDEGYRELPISSSPEIYNNTINAWFLKTTNYDLSLIKYVFLKAASLATVLDLEDDAKKYRTLAAELRPYALSPNNELMYAPGFPYNESHRHFSNAMAIHPLGLIQWEDDAASQAIIKNTIALYDSIGGVNWNGYSYAWLANMKARAKDGEGAAEALRIFSNAFCSANSFHVNGDQSGKGYSGRTYRPVTLEGNFAAAAALQEMLLQSYQGFIEIMPAIPASWKDVSFTTLRAEGAFLVSAAKQKGKITEVEIVAEKGGKAILKNPFAKYNVLSCTNAAITRSDDKFIAISFTGKGSISLRNDR